MHRNTFAHVPTTLFTKFGILSFNMELFPYPLRKSQKAIMQTIKNTLDSGGHMVFESGTGSGKTICALSSTLEYALAHHKKIIYATRTNAQQQQVIFELRAIRNSLPSNKEQVFGVGIQGRANMCILARKNPDFVKGTAEELSKLCSYEKKKARAVNQKNKGCQYYRTFLEQKEKVTGLVEWAIKTLPTAEEFITYCEQQHICPYEVNRLLIREATVVVVPYVYVLNAMIRNMLFDWLSVPEEDMILIVDEAHNIPDFIRDLFSVQLTTYMLTNCLYEAENFGDPALIDRTITVSRFCNLLLEIINILRDTYVYGILESGIQKGPVEKTDAFIPSNELETELLSRLNITSKKLHDIIGDLIAYGEKIQDYRQKEGKLPRSYLHKLGVFLDVWMSLESEQYTKLVVDASQGKNPRIEAFCLDPSVGTGILREFHATIHMSGTLEPLEEYRDSLGLSEDTELVSYPSPFPQEHRKILFVRDVTTKYAEMARDKHIIPRIKKHITDICNTFPRNTMVFFPSFDIMSNFLNDGMKQDITRCLYVEEQGMSQIDLMDIVSDFKECSSKQTDGAALFSVIGGRISEGMDFPAEELEVAVIVGIPYPKPTARQRGLQRYYDIKFRKGWEYTVEAPTARKVLQSIGRLIRNEQDRGIAIILDRRAPRFTRYLDNLTETKNPLRDIDRFLNQ